MRRDGFQPAICIILRRGLPLSLRARASDSRNLLRSRIKRVPTDRRGVPARRAARLELWSTLGRAMGKQDRPAASISPFIKCEYPQNALFSLATRLWEFLHGYFAASSRTPFIIDRIALHRAPDEWRLSNGKISVHGFKRYSLPLITSDWRQIQGDRRGKSEIGYKQQARSS